MLNGPDWYDNDANPGATDWTSPTGSVCQSSVLDVKVTEDDSFPLASLIPLYPDIKRKARVQIEEVEGVSGLLPIAVRVPKPLSAAAVFYNESTGIDPQHQVLLPGRRHSRASVGARRLVDLFEQHGRSTMRIDVVGDRQRRRRRRAS